MRDTGHFVGGVRVLDLAKCASASAVDGVSLVQGLRTTAAFFTFLRANLTLSTSALSPNPSTLITLDQWDPDALDLSHLSIPCLPGQDLSPSLIPDSSRPSSPTSTVTTISSYSSSSSSSSRNDTTRRRRPRQDGRSHSLHGANALATDSDDNTTDLLLEPLTSPADRAAGLALVAASIAQMDHRAASALALHPACLSVLMTCWAAAYRFWALRSSLASAGAHEYALLALLLCTAAATYLAAIRHFTSAYAELAETARRSFLHPDDILISARRGDTLVGVLVLRLEPRGCTTSSPSLYSNSSSSNASSTMSSSASGKASGKKKSTRPPSLRGGNGVVRAWTTRLGHRRAGVGRALLDAAVRSTKDSCGRDAQVGFAREHAHSAMVLPGVFNGCFRRDEMRAARALEEALGQWGLRRPGKPKRRRR